MAYYLGIDGGGTKTRCALGDETTVLATAASGGSNIVRVGETRARESLHTAIRQVCATAQITFSQIRSLCIGASGAGRPEIAARVRAIVDELNPEFPASRIEVTTDTIIALQAAFGSGPGVIAIAGTGSIVLGRDAAGHTARAGGWGFAVSDEGSGHWIGRQAVSAVLRARDRNEEIAEIHFEHDRLTDVRRDERRDRPARSKAVSGAVRWNRQQDRVEQLTLKLLQARLGRFDQAK